jgi:superfamily II DNA helicase RecQ
MEDIDGETIDKVEEEIEAREREQDPPEQPPEQAEPVKPTLSRI